VQIGLTLEQAASHSLAQLEMLAQAANRVEARKALLALDSTANAFAAVMVKEGATGMKKLREMLEKQANGQ